ncbi:MAG: sigma-70 family RNA polymerase sigma factor [Aquabacterium sp.]
MADTDPSARQHLLADLLSRTALGDRVAFDTLYRHTSAHLLGVILRIQSDRAQAEDVLQEVYVNIWRSAQSFNPALSQPSTWLNSIARNRAIDSLRRRQTSPQTVSSVVTDADDEETDMLNALPSDAPGPLDLLEQASEAMALQDCMAQLNKGQRQSLALAYYQGLSHSEVAEQLRQPLGTVKSWVRRGLQGLKNCLERASMALS